MKMRTYSELCKYHSLDDRFKYLELDGEVSKSTFGFDRYLNQLFYRTPEWIKVRREVIIRDNGNELGLDDYPINGSIFIHHMNPIQISDIELRKSEILNPEYLISCSFVMHNAIHYGDNTIMSRYKYANRIPNDTIPWKR